MALVAQPGRMHFIVDIELEHEGALCSHSYRLSGTGPRIFIGREAGDRGESGERPCRITREGQVIINLDGVTWLGGGRSVYENGCHAALGLELNGAIQLTLYEKSTNGTDWIRDGNSAEKVLQENVVIPEKGGATFVIPRKRRNGKPGAQMKVSYRQISNDEYQQMKRAEAIDCQAEPETKRRKTTYKEATSSLAITKEIVKEMGAK